MRMFCAMQTLLFTLNVMPFKCSQWPLHRQHTTTTTVIKLYAASLGSHWDYSHGVCLNKELLAYFSLLSIFSPVLFLFSTAKWICRFTALFFHGKADFLVSLTWILLFPLAMISWSRRFVVYYSRSLGFWALPNFSHSFYGKEVFFLSLWAHLSSHLFG